MEQIDILVPFLGIGFVLLRIIIGRTIIVFIIDFKYAFTCRSSAGAVAWSRTFLLLKNSWKKLRSATQSATSYIKLTANKILLVEN